jgi:hypothetical protein
MCGAYSAYRTRFDHGSGCGFVAASVARDRDQAIAAALGDLARSARMITSEDSMSRRDNASSTADVARVWHGDVDTGYRRELYRVHEASGLGFVAGAGDGNRTRMTSLEG